MRNKKISLKLKYKINHKLDKYIFEDNILKIDNHINSIHYKLMKGGEINYGEIDNAKNIISDSIQKDISNIDKLNNSNINSGNINYESIIPTLHDEMNTKDSNHLKEKANLKIKELQKILINEDKDIENYNEENLNQIEKLKDESKKYENYILKFMKDPLTSTEKVLLKSKSTIIYSQVLVIFLRSIICANLIYSQNSKQIIITIWEIVAESPHLWVYLNEYGIKSMGWLGKQLIKFPLFRILFELITRMVSKDNDQSMEEVIDYLTEFISSYLNKFLTKAASAYNVYRYLSSKDGPSSDLQNILSDLGSGGLLNLFKQTPNLLIKSGNTAYNFFNLSAKPENIITLYAKQLNGDPNANKIVKALANNTSWVISWLCSIVCFNIPLPVSFLSSSKNDCRLCNILLDLPFVMSSLYSISLDIMEGVILLKKYYGNDKNINQSTLISALCVRRLPYETTDSLIERKSDQKISLLADSAKKGWIKEDLNGEIRSLTADEIMKNEIPNQEEAIILRKKLIENNKDSNLSQLLKEKIGLDKDNNLDSIKRNQFIYGQVKKSNLINPIKSVNNLSNKISSNLKDLDQLYLNNNISKSNNYLDKKLSNLGSRSKYIIDNLDNIQPIKKINDQIIDNINKSEKEIKEFQKTKIFNGDNEKQKIFNSLKESLEHDLPNKKEIEEKFRKRELDNIIIDTRNEFNDPDYDKNQEIQNKINNIKKYLNEESKGNKSLLTNSPYIIENDQKIFLDKKLLNHIEKNYNQKLSKLPLFLLSEKFQNFFQDKDYLSSNDKLQLVSAYSKLSGKQPDMVLENEKLQKRKIDEEAIKKYLIFRSIEKKHKENLDQKNENNLNFDDSDEQMSSLINSDIDMFDFEQTSTNDQYSDNFLNERKGGKKLKKIYNQFKRTKNKRNKTKIGTLKIKLKGSGKIDVEDLDEDLKNLLFFSKFTNEERDAIWILSNLSLKFSEQEKNDFGLAMYFDPFRIIDFMKQDKYSKSSNQVKKKLLLKLVNNILDKVSENQKKKSGIQKKKKFN